MNISYNWLKDLIDIDLSPDELGRKLTGVGLAVEGIHPHGEDFVLDVDLTSNRPDCLSHLGVAREIGVITKRALKADVAARNEAPMPAVLAGQIVTIDEPELCHRFTARILKGVKIGPSPQWMVDRLEAIGERSINNVADITNYVMHELGQPMHSFDLDKLAGGRIVVRLAKDGDKLTTLDGVERDIDSSMLMICDAEKPISVGGVMGGLDSSITDTTVNVLLEVAYFKRANIRATSRKLKLNTEASHRFERGVDIENILRASNRAADLICELASGALGDLVDVYPTRSEHKYVESVDISHAVKRLTGLEVEAEECVRILSDLGIKLNSDKRFSSPSWRHDIAIEEDLVEEIARHTGYENIKEELPPAFGAGEYQATEIREKLLRQSLVDIGFDEALSYSFIDTRFDDIFEAAPGVIDEKVEEKYITLQDSVIEGSIRMRPSVLPGLLESVRLNFNHQRRDLRLFEVGKVFAAKSGEDNLPNEQELFAIVMTGGETQANRAMAARDFDFYDLKGAVEAALEAAGATAANFSPTDIKHLRKGQSAAISISNETVGYLGRLSDEIAASYKFRQPVYIAEINLQSVLNTPVDQVTYRPLAKYPGVVRDVSFVVGRQITFSNIRDAIVKQDHELCRNVMFADVYEGKGLAEDERSITVRLEYRSDDRTLIEDEVESLHRQIISSVEEKLAIKMRF